ncbi:MAG TPA: hypothetical protein VLZ53_01510 [Devosia sp.]|nr:hypothetical protein [Devosia sp.]
MATLLAGVIGAARIRYRAWFKHGSSDLNPETQMIHDTYDKSAEPKRFSDIVTNDEQRPSIGRQIINGITGMLLLLVTGLIILLLVLWKTP